MHTLVFWDIDETLITSSGLAERLLRQAILTTYGPSPALAQLAMGGKTDQQIICEAYPDQPPAALLAVLPAFAAQYMAFIEAQRAALQVHGQVLDGVLPALMGLADAGAHQSVITGNIEPVAHYKIQLFGLTPYLDLSVGAYGSDHAERTRLLPIALKRYAARQRAAPPARVVVVGDTPADVACGRAAGAYTVAVASGAWNIGQLHEAGADVVLADLGDTALVLTHLLGSSAAAT